GLATNFDTRVIRLTERRGTTVTHHWSGSRGHVCAVLDQVFDYRSMPLVGSLHQCRGAALNFLGVGISTMVKQHANGVHDTRTSSKHERAAAQREIFIGIRATSDEGFNNL